MFTYRDEITLEFPGHARQNVEASGYAFPAPGEPLAILAHFQLATLRNLRCLPARFYWLGGKPALQQRFLDQRSENAGNCGHKWVVCQSDAKHCAITGEFEIVRHSKKKCVLLLH